jgi:hypothetical protein
MLGELTGIIVLLLVVSHSDAITSAIVSRRTQSEMATSRCVLMMWFEGNTADACRPDLMYPQQLFGGWGHVSADVNRRALERSATAEG